MVDLRWANVCRSMQVGPSLCGESRSTPTLEID